ncbi:MAG: hypothetical protein IKY83_12860 [Proteobacteria bacterium]|nr:hypothetical protein [Pseudomonadota bacterium]
MRNFITLIVGLMTISMISACSAEVNETKTEASKAYVDFRTAVEACGQIEDDSVVLPEGTQCDKQAIWNALDAQSKGQFVDAFNALKHIDQIIVDYFDPIEHKQMRLRTGVNVLKDVPIHNEFDLFNYIFKPEKLVFNKNTVSALTVKEEIASNETPNIVTIERNLDNYSITMIKESDNVWRTDWLLDNINTSLEPIFASEAAMQEYAKGNLIEEMKRRTQVRDYFLLKQAVKEERAKALLKQEQQAAN